MKKLLFLLIIMIAIFSTVFAKEFSDVSKDHWAYKYVDILSDMSIINGYENGTFNPSKKITKAEYIKLLVGTIISKADNEYISKNMSTTKNWYDLYVEYAKESGFLIDNYSDESIKAEVSRKDMVKMLEPLIRFIQYGTEYGNVDVDDELSRSQLEEAYGVQNGEEVKVIKDASKFNVEKIETKVVPTVDSFRELSKEDNEKIQKTFSDVSALKMNEKSALLFLYDKGFVNGYDDGTFKPEQTMNRAEVATIIYKVINFIEKGENK